VERPNEGIHRKVKKLKNLEERREDWRIHCEKR
jgi:hypothetical protein